MEDILKSGIMAIALLLTLIFAAPVLEDGKDETKISDSERLELKTEKNIHIPL